MSDCFRDYEPADLYWPRVSVSRRERRCDECGHTIHRGDRYEYVWACWEGQWGSYQTCGRCLALRDYVTAHVPCVCWAHGNMLVDGHNRGLGIGGAGLVVRRGEAEDCDSEARMSLLAAYISTNKSTAEIASLAGLTLADLRPLDMALPGDDVQLPRHVHDALIPVLGRRQTTPGKRTIPLIGRRGSGSPIQYGAVSEDIVKALMGGRMRTAPELAESLLGQNKARTREKVCKALRRLESHGMAVEMDEHPEVNTRWRVKRWCLTAGGEEAGELLKAEIKS